jgi:Hint module
LHRRMDQLLIGDRVKVAERTFSDVFMFTHKLHNAIAMFVVIRTASGHSISLTPGHYIYVNGVLTSAASVKIGDELDLSTSAHSTVISVSETVQTGLFNPQTLHGDIAVNGIIASTYTTAVSPVLGHAWLTPLRMVYSALGSTTAMLENGAEFAASILPGGSTTY